MIERHGLCKTRTYTCWSNMKARCHNSNNPNYKYYGAKGITVCDEWRNSFNAFYRDMGECKDGMSIDRVYSDKGYFPENCRWLTRSENSMRKLNHSPVDGETMNTMTLSEILDELRYKQTPVISRQEMQEKILRDRHKKIYKMLS